MQKLYLGDIDDKILNLINKNENNTFVDLKDYGNLNKISSICKEKS